MTAHPRSQWGEDDSCDLTAGERVEVYLYDRGWIGYRRAHVVLTRADGHGDWVIVHMDAPRSFFRASDPPNHRMTVRPSSLRRLDLIELLGELA